MNSSEPITLKDNKGIISAQKDGEVAVKEVTVKINRKQSENVDTRSEKEMIKYSVVDAEMKKDEISSEEWTVNVENTLDKDKVPSESKSANINRDMQLEECVVRDDIKNEYEVEL